MLKAKYRLLTRSTILLIVIHLLLSSKLIAEGENFNLRKYDINDGLSHSWVRAIVQDSLGFIWIGTDDGLNRYDGYNFKVYRNNPTDSSSLCHNAITSLMVDSKGFLWVGTGRGLSIFNPSTNKFTSYFYDENDYKSLNSSNIRTFFEDTQGSIYVGTINGLNRVEEKNGMLEFHRFRTAREPNNTEIFEGTVHQIVEDKWERLWIATQGKKDITNQDIGFLSCFDKNEKTFTHYNENNTQLSSSAVQSLFMDVNENLWVGSIDAGINIIILDEKGNINSVSTFSNDDKDINSIQHNFVKKIVGDQNGNVWLGTYSGLSSISLKSNTITNYFKTKNNFSETISTMIFDMLIDHSGSLWIATENGLFVLHSTTQPFKVYTPSKDNHNSILAGDVFALLEDSESEIWAASYGVGLNRILTNENGEEVVLHYTTDQTLPTSQILDIIEDENKNIWCATYAGLLKLNKQAGSNEISVKQYLPAAKKSDGLTSLYYAKLYTLSDRKFLARTYQSGIDYIEFKNEEIIVENISHINRDSKSHKINEVYLDERNNLWVITEASIFKGVIQDNGKIQFIPVRITNADWSKILELKISYIHADNQRNVWMGTFNGLVKLTIDNDSLLSSGSHLSAVVKIFTEKDGLPNNTVYGIVNENSGDLWLSTNRGLSKFSLKEETFENYLIEGGPSTNEFNERALTKGADGKVYFGCIGGFVSFYPDSIKKNTFVPPVVFTSLKVLNKVIDPSVENRMLSQSIEKTESIELSYHDYVFTIEFSALNYFQPEKNRYAYKLNGFHDQWIENGTNRQVTFTNLDDGEYELQVRASNNDGVWNEEAASLTVIIHPPLWKTLWAYTLYGFAFIGFVLLILKIRERELKREIETAHKIEAAKAEERIEVRTKTSQDFHDEAGNQLTKISLITSLARKEAKDNKVLEEYLVKIQENVKELSSGMRDFLWVLDAGKDTLFDMMKRMEDFGNTMFQPTEIRFSVKGIKTSFTQINLPMEVRRSLILIFKEAINNCIKYSGAEHVYLDVKLSDEELTIKLTDDGIGFNMNEKNEGYGIQNMIARAEKLNGKINIASSKEKGTRIEFIGNITHMSN